MTSEEFWYFTLTRYYLICCKVCFQGGLRMSSVFVAFIIAFLVFWFASLAYEAGNPTKVPTPYCT